MAFLKKSSAKITLCSKCGQRGVIVYKKVWFCKKCFKEVSSKKVGVKSEDKA